MAPTTKPKLITLNVDVIKPWANNPRKDHAVKEIQTSMETFGYMNPIVVQASTNRIIVGHGRYQAVKEAGLKEIPVVAVDIDDNKADMYTLADNKIAELSNWDFTKMADLLLEFDEKNFNVNLLGFTDAEVEKIMQFTPPELENSEEGEEILAEGPEGMEASHVRMVQLFLSADNIEEFQGYINTLSKKFGTQNITDTVMECLKRENSQVETSTIG